MTRIEQHKMIQELRDFSSRMKRDDSDILEGLVKRDKDDEDLDAIAIRSLERLYHQYVQRASKKDVEDLWKKLTEQKRNSPER